MTEQKLLEKLTGVNNPRFITPREDAIIKECLAIINNMEEQLNIHSVVVLEGTLCECGKEYSEIDIEHAMCHKCWVEIKE